MLAANTVVVPAIANTLSLKNFTGEVVKTVDDHPIGYLLDMDYDVAFYSQRTIPIVLPKDPDKLDYLVCWENIWQRYPADARAQYQVITTSNPTELDGSGRMLLLKKTRPRHPPASGKLRRQRLALGAFRSSTTRDAPLRKGHPRFCTRCRKSWWRAAHSNSPATSESRC